jgi:hypothetical protein
MHVSSNTRASCDTLGVRLPLRAVRGSKPTKPTPYVASASWNRAAHERKVRDGTAKAVAVVCNAW